RTWQNVRRPRRARRSKYRARASGLVVSGVRHAALQGKAGIMSSSAGVLPTLRVHAGLMLGVVALLAAQPLPAQQAAPLPPLVKPDALMGISQHVQVIPDNSVPLVPNVGYIIGDKAVLVIDT